MLITLKQNSAEQRHIMKKIAAIAALTLFGAGCTSTVTLGPKANESTFVGASTTKSGASITIPFVKAEIGASETTPTKKK